MSMFYNTSLVAPGTAAGVGAEMTPGMSYPLGPPISLADASADVDRTKEVRSQMARQQQQQQQQQQQRRRAQQQVRSQRVVTSAAEVPASPGGSGAIPNRRMAAAASTAASAASASALASASASSSYGIIGGGIQQQKQEQQEEEVQPDIIASIVARQTHAAQLAEMAAAEYERAALDLERAAAAAAATAPSQPPLAAEAASAAGTLKEGNNTAYGIALAKAKFLGQQLGLSGMAGAGGDVSTASSTNVAHQGLDLLAQMQTTRRNPLALAQQEVQSATGTIIASTAGVDGTERAASASASASIEDQLDAAEAVLSLMGGVSSGKRGGGAKMSTRTNGNESSGNSTTARSARQKKLVDAAILQQRDTQQTQRPGHPLIQYASNGPNVSQETDAAFQPTSNNGTQRVGHGGSVVVGSAQDLDEEEGAAKGGKRKRRKRKKPGQPRRPLSAYNIFFSEERARIIRRVEAQLSSEEDDDQDPLLPEGDAAPAGDSAGSDGPLKKRRLSLDSSGTNTSRRASLAGSDGEDSSSPAPTGADAAAGQKAQQILLDRRVNSTGEDPGKRRHRRTHGKIGFRDLACQIGQSWRALPPDRLEEYKRLAEIDMKRYKADMARWNAANGT
mmetsp:Transcript_7380/g.16450  ORF Transcript_7380/g.16450 Transcript_7380/m.16450 type:complete len:619 (+) Transcript_7380:344-2200(+)